MEQITAQFKELINLIALLTDKLSNLLEGFIFLLFDLLVMVFNAALQFLIGFIRLILDYLQ
ncbi:MAG: hypothetical protein AAB596_02815 [Patescibacteria group bacterium]